MFCYCCDASLRCAWGGVLAGFPVLFVFALFCHMTSVASEYSVRTENVG